jgi:serine kinase of HPr protein (carbohydrate metabolism regulator)
VVLHAGLVAQRYERRWRGALIRGASGAGKSTLALRALAATFALVADDRTVVWSSGGAVFGKAPAPLAGLIEVRGVGIVDAAQVLPMAPVALLVDLIAERMPEPETVILCGVALPRLRLAVDDPHAILRLSAALAASQHRL